MSADQSVLSERPKAGSLIRDWRRRRRISQLDLALAAEVSMKHLSFVETGRSTPSRTLLLRLAEQLEMPLRERNALLAAGGYVAAFPERPLSDPAMRVAREAVELVLSGHEPYPALAIDRSWQIVARNSGVAWLTEKIAPELAAGGNLLRILLHSEGLSGRIRNLDQWRGHLLGRLRRQLNASGDAELAALMAEFGSTGGALSDGGELLVPLHLQTSKGDLNLFVTTTLFGGPMDVTLSELALECFYPTDEESRRLLMAGA